MRSSKVSPGDAGTALWADNLRDDAYGSSMLLAHEQTTPGMTLYVEPGVYYIGTTRVLFTGGNSPSFTAPTSNPRIDLLTADSSGTLAIVQGTENASPVAPSYPTNKMVICEVYNVVGETALYDNDNQIAGQGYILNDVRPLAAPPYISSTSQFGSAVVPDSALVSSFIHDPGGDAQGDIIYFNGSAWARLPAGTSGYMLQTQGPGANPLWAAGLPNAFQPVGGSGTVLQDATTVRSNNTTTPTKVKTLSCNVAGFYTFNANLADLAATYSGYAALYQNGVQVATYSYGADTSYHRNTFGTFYANVNDYFDLYLWVQSGATSAMSCNSFQVTSQNGLILIIGGNQVGFQPSGAVNLGTPPTSNFTITLN
ncbi:MAG TPA: hypothetical protein VNJ52_04945 [Patescibacteria group bacterium]|nr:hypothetical protein [Patescibacteria group bacterium]